MIPCSLQCHANPARLLPSRGQRRAVALVIVLAFIVLLTGVTVAFFSSSLLYRQISNSSASEAKVDLFAQGAVDTIVGDLKQEIAAGSTITSPATGVNIYTPTVPQTAVPAIVAPVPRTFDSTTKLENDGLNNLVKGSFYQKPFYSGTNYNTNYSASNRAANVATTSTSQNGRSISLARWNKALLIPKLNSAATNDTDFTPAAAFAAPNWVLVARDGSNPTGAFNTNMATSASGATTIIGRYAYTIYDEGGLLDMNVAGYPLSSALVPAADTKYVPYKSALAFADLSQLPGFNTQLTGTSYLTPTRYRTVINDIVGWRNYASAQPASGNLAATNGYSWGSAAGNPRLQIYSQSVLANAFGFLKIANAGLYDGTTVGSTGQSDRMFASRQELMRLLLNGIAQQGTGSATVSDRAIIQNTLQYMGTFSRDVNQPCFAPDSTRPKIAVATSGGNDGSGGDNIINPSFLAARVTGGFTRNDGTSAVIGDPLVNKRFPLNRLAWLTYKGPSSQRNIPASNPGVTSPDYDMWQLVNTYGISQTYLQQGTPANILKYFGLTWAADTMANYGDSQLKWRYDHGISSSGLLIIGTLDKVAAGNRDPDFFEVVKAAVCAGSIGKAGSDGTVGFSLNWNYARDKSIDNSVIQIVANMIDQFDVDGFPTRILFDPKSAPGAPSFHQEFYGVENLPYLYRMREGMLQVHEPVPLPSADASGQNVKLYTTSADLSDPGVGVDLILPEIWNPHDMNSSTGTPGPTNFRFVVDGIDPEFVDPTDAGNSYVRTVWSPSYLNGNGASAFTPPAAFTNYASSGASTSSPLSAGATFAQLYTPTPHAVTANETALLFQVPTARKDLFREPTLLARVNEPYGSVLQPGPNHRLLTDPALKSFVTHGGIQSDYDDPFNLGNPPSVSHAQAEPKGQTGYLGVAVGAYPLRWVVQESGGSRRFVVTANGGGSLTTKAPDGNYTYRVQCLDPNSSGSAPAGPWMTYDVKYTDIIANLGHNVEAYGSALQAQQAALTFDPRTNRFGAGSWATSPGYADYQPPYSLSDWSEAKQGVLISNRPDNHSGYDLYISGNRGYTSSIGWFPGAGNGTAFANQEPLRYGLFSQNNLNITNDGIVRSGIGPGRAGSKSAQYYADPDGVIRRATAAYVPYAVGSSPATTTIGLPEAIATTYPAAPSGSGSTDTNVGSATSQSQSRPIVLNRPFRSVAELGYVFSGTPWRNLDFMTPASGNTALMDVLSINELSDPTQNLVAGKVNINTRQVPVLQAILSGAYTDETNGFSPAPSNTPMVALTSGTLGTTPTSGQAAAIAQALVTRTGTTPLRNLAELVGSWTGTGTPTPASPVDGMTAYRGFSGTDPVTPMDTLPNLTKIFAAPPFTTDLSATNTPNISNIERFRESVVRPLSAVGTARTWNLMIDVVAQTGRYPQNAANAANPLAAFIVEGEQRYWVHIAIDRFTGKVVDKQVEIVKE